MSHSPPNWSRRRFLKTAFLAASGVLFAGARKPFLVNPCLDPSDLFQSPWLDNIWQGLDPAKVWDCHVHLAGIGDSNQGLHIGKKYESLWHPALYSLRLVFMNAGCVAAEAGTVDENYARRLLLLAQSMPSGFKAMLFAFDWHHNDGGQPVPRLSSFYVPDSYARQLARANPDVFEWVASIHPYRQDAVDRLEEAAAQGTRAVKWLPAAQNINPASSKCDAFFAAVARLGLPLIIHCGAERAVHSPRLIALGNPLRLRRALDAGVKVVVAHCAGSGYDEDLDKPGTRKKSFALFSRLMERSEWKENLFGDISAIVLSNRKVSVLKTLLMRDDWHGRLLNGSDYPLPGILPMISPSMLAHQGLLPKEQVTNLQALRYANALYFDLALKRSLSWQGKSFPAKIFETRTFFENVDNRN